MVWKHLNSRTQLRFTTRLHETTFPPATQASKQREKQLSPDLVAEAPSLGPPFPCPHGRDHLHPPEKAELSSRNGPAHESVNRLGN